MFLTQTLSTFGRIPCAHDEISHSKCITQLATHISLYVLLLAIILSQTLLLQAGSFGEGDTNGLYSAGFKPFMEYAGSYALYNYRLVDPSRGLDYDNLRLIRAFEHGLDHHSSEAGFVLVHVAMVKESGPLVAGAMNTLAACDRNDRQAFNDGLNQVVDALTEVNRVMNSKSENDGSLVVLVQLPH